MSIRLIYSKEMVNGHFKNKTDEWKIKKAWIAGEYVVVEYANGQQDRLYKAELDWIKELEPDVELVE